jgi:hypothetical protein
MRSSRDPLRGFGSEPVRYRARVHPGRRPLATALAAALLGLAGHAGAESALRIEFPQSFGTVRAGTYDAERHRVGAAHLVAERLDDGNVRLFSESGITGGPRTVVTAELAPEPGGRWLELLLQESRSFDPDGTPLGLLRIDHRSRTGSCTPLSGDAETRTLELPAGDRVANVPMNLLFQPLVRGDAERIDFQFFLCGRGPRLVDFEATRAPANGSGTPREIVEIRFGPQLGPVLSLLAPSFLPRLAFWFDRAQPHRWLAHRIPLYRDGPEVLVVRDGIPPGWLADP